MKIQIDPDKLRAEINQYKKNHWFMCSQHRGLVCDCGVDILNNTLDALSATIDKWQADASTMHTINPSVSAVFGKLVVIKPRQKRSKKSTKGGDTSQS